jgi:hypothetical protein
MFGSFSKAGSASKPATKTASPTESLKLEALEDRMALSYIYAHDGKLWIHGSDYAEHVSVEQSRVWNGWGFDTRFTVKEYGRAVASFGAAQLYNGDIIFVGHGGNDTFVNNTRLNLWAYGGSGWDTLIGGSGNDQLLGEGDGDWLEGRSGHDNLMGWDGNDTLRGGEGNDTLQGMNGQDQLFGEGGNDWLHANPYDGISGEHMVGGPGADAFAKQYWYPGLTDTAVDLNEAEGDWIWPQ